MDNVPSWKRPLYFQRGDPVGVVASRRSTSIRSRGWPVGRGLTGGRYSRPPRCIARIRPPSSDVGLVAGR